MVIAAVCHLEREGLPEVPLSSQVMVFAARRNAYVHHLFSTASVYAIRLTAMGRSMKVDTGQISYG